MRLSHVHRVRLLTLTGVVAVIVLTTSDRVPAQTAAAPRMILTPQRALALIRAADRKLPYIPGEVLIKFRSGVSPAGQQRALDALRSRPAIGQVRWSGGVAILRDPRELDATVLAAQLSRQPEVEYAEPNYLYRTNAVPNDPGYATSQWNFAALDMPRAWDINPGGKTTLTIAVLDTGITTVNDAFPFTTWNGASLQRITVPFRTNPDLSADRLTDPLDLVFWEGPVLDMEGHGTHVSATLGEDTNNNLAQAGIAYNVKIMPVKVCMSFWDVQFVLSGDGFEGFAPLDSGGCPTDAIAAGIRYAVDNGARVINLSLGGEMPSNILRTALTYAAEQGAFVAIAVGNGFDEGNPVEYPAAYSPAINGVMAVGAVGRSLTRAYYSSTGDHVEIAAPGGSIVDGGEDGLIWQAALDFREFDPETVLFPRFDRYAQIASEGTSMAAPHVSGIAALIVTQGVTSPAAVEALIKRTARDLGPTGRDTEYGFGLIQPRAALFGFGVAR